MASIAVQIGNGLLWYSRDIHADSIKEVISLAVTFMSWAWSSLVAQVASWHAFPLAAAESNRASPLKTREVNRFPTHLACLISGLFPHSWLNFMQWFYVISWKFSTITWTKHMKKCYVSKGIEADFCLLQASDSVVSIKAMVEVTPPAWDRDVREVKLCVWICWLFPADPPF